jgi:hypothetical protein
MNVAAKPWYRSKTVWVNVFTLAIMIIGVIAGSPLAKDYGEYVALVLSIANVVLRFLTTQPINGGGNV